LDDSPTPEQIDEVLDEFERVAFSGLETDQYTYYAVYHGEGNGAGHIHIVVPRVELQTGKAMNIAPPGHHKTYDLLVDKFNIKYEWASPKEISRRRTLARDKISIHAKMPNKEAQLLIHQAVDELVKHGLISDRATLKQFLEKQGEITREGKDYISLRPEGFRQAIRLKGAYYEREFGRTSEKVAREQGKRTTTSSADREREVARIEQVIESVIAKRAEYNRKRYVEKNEKFATRNEHSETNDFARRENDDQDVAREQSRDQRRSNQSTSIAAQRFEQHKSPILGDSADRGLGSDGRSISRLAGLWGGHIRPQPSPASPQRTDRQDESGFQSARDRDRRGLSSASKKYESADGIRERKREAGSNQNDQGAIDDAARKRIEARARATERAIQQGIDKHHEAIRRQLAEDRERISEDHRRAEEHNREAKSNLHQISRNIKELADQHRQSVAAELEANASATDEQVSTLARIAGGIREWLGKSIQGVKNELEKMKLFEEAREKIVSIRQKINLSPRR
jgi:hypothetical protein